MRLLGDLNGTAPWYRSVGRHIPSEPYLDWVIEVCTVHHPAKVCVRAVKPTGLRGLPAVSPGPCKTDTSAEVWIYRLKYRFLTRIMITVLKGGRMITILNVNGGMHRSSVLTSRRRQRLRLVLLDGKHPDDTDAGIWADENQNFSHIDSTRT